MKRFLAESKNYKVTSEYECVSMYFKNKLFKKPINIGVIQGEPECAMISRDEKFLVIAGCGLIIYRLEKPFIEYGSKENTQQYFEFFKLPPKLWWTNGLHQTTIDSDWKYFRFVAANDEGEFIYKMDSTTFEIEKIISIPLKDI